MSRPAPTILVADDEEMVLGFIVLVLRKAGFRVLSASGGEAALKLCQDGAEPIDLALVDSEMPRMDGGQLCARLWSLYPNLRVLFMSGYGEDDARRRGAIPEP